jgi:hypothetical protein
VQIEHWTAERRAAVVTSSHPGYAVLRLMEYPAWRVTVNGAAMPMPVRVHRADGLMVIPLKPGITRINVHWGTTGDAWAGRWISLAALAITLAWMWKERRTRRGEKFR